MKTLSKDFKKITVSIKVLYLDMLEILKIHKKRSKKDFKKLTKEANKTIDNIEPESMFFGRTFENFLFSSMFLFESLSILEDDKNERINLMHLEHIDLKLLLKDKDFKIFLKQILIMDIIYQKGIKNFNLLETGSFKHNKDYFGDIRTIFLAYFLVKEPIITHNKIINITSFIFKDSIVINTSHLTYEEQELLRQIRSGIKYEKVKESTNCNNTTRKYNKNEKFSILNRAKQTIRIKYTSTKKHKHLFHKSPKEHIRKGHYRYYKSGKKVWIQSSIINPNQI